MDGTHRTKKRTAAILLGFFAAATIAMPSAQAADRTVSELIPVGQTVGVKLFSDGVLVVGFSDGESPARTADSRRAMSSRPSAGKAWTPLRNSANFWQKTARTPRR